MKKHDIQMHILRKLITADSGLRYRDMKPEEIENDLYNYHLKYLVRDGYVSHEHSLYFLTDDGKKYVEDIAPLDPIGNVSELFRVNVLAGVIRKHGHTIEILNQHRKRHPYYGDTGIIGGTVRKGERIVDAASRKLFDETGLTGEFRLLGVIRKLRYKPNGELFTDIFFHVCFTDEYYGDLKESTDFGDNYWLDLESSIQMERDSSMGSIELANVLEKLRIVEYKEIPVFYVEEIKIVPSI